MKLKYYLKMKQAQWRFRNRNLTWAKFLYYYLILSGMFAALYSVFALVATKPYWYGFVPIFLVLVVGLIKVLHKNWKLMAIYLGNVDHGRLLLRMNARTHFLEMHKFKLLNWVYPGKKMVRNETAMKLSDKLRNGIELTKDEKKLLKKKRIYCPQQLLDGFNKALLVDTLIYAHHSIKPLDDELRDILDLTDENMLAFSLKREVDKCRSKEEKEKLDKYMKAGYESMKKHGIDG